MPDHNRIYGARMSHFVPRADPYRVAVFLNLGSTEANSCDSERLLLRRGEEHQALLRFVCPKVAGRQPGNE